tara:strand:- start:4953 stop:7112 length:2160 start_codon:yes stop_codon:yes gene_type:complete
MPEYRTYGRRDDRISRDGDVGFVGFNNRLRPDQLQSGLLADSQNIRLDRNGEAQVRKGVELITAPLAIGGAALVLPFYLVSDDGSVTVTQTGGELVITNVNATNFPSSGTINLSGVTGISPDPNGNRAFTRNSATQITVSDQTYTGTAGGTATVKFGILDDTAVNSIYGSCGYSDPNNNASQYIIIASNAKAISINVDTGTTTDIAYPVGVTVSQSVDMIQAFNRVFIFRNGETALEWNGSFSGSPAFTKVSSGTFTQPVQLTGTITTSNGICTVDTSSAHNLTTGDTVHVESKAGSNLEVGESYVVTVVDSDTFTIFVQHPDETNTPNVIFQQTVSVGLGFSHMPAPPFAVYHQRRLVMPYRFTVDASSDSFTARGILDEVIASDILDSDTYDQIYAQYRFNAGTADFVVGLHSFSEDVLLVFNRNSIHQISNSINLQSATTQLLTNEVGCVARKSIVQVGNRVIFLSDNGIYGTEFFDEYNLRGTETPLSEPINETIQTINKDAWENSVATYFDNRYFIAVPTGSSTSNNTILVYNFLNKQWESVDTVSDSNYHSENLIVVGDGDNRGVYAVNDIGGVHKLDERVDGIDRVITQIGGSQKNLQADASITTRQFTLGTLERKSWKQFEMHVQSSEDNTSDFSISSETENPDATISLGNLSDFVGSALAIDEDVSIRGRIGNRRGYGIQFTINNTIGRPRLRAIDVDGSISFRSTQKAD